MAIKHTKVVPEQATESLVNALVKAGIDYEVAPEAKPEPNYRSGKRNIHFVSKKGETMDTCATISDKYICCNVKVLKSVSNCPYDCSYCFLQNYLNDGNTKVVADIAAMMDEVKQKCEAEPQRLFRIGTWELGDSLALENETGQAQHLIKAFSSLPNALLELKTKSAIVDPILGLDHQQKTVVSWSLNTEYIVNSQEHKTARLHERLEALTKVTKAGYLVGIHIDPMIYYENCESDYAGFVKQVIEATNAEQIAWISLGSLRFNPEMKKKMEHNFPASTISATEMILGNDGKLRYPKPLRLKMYEAVLDALREALGIQDLSPLTAVTKHKPLFYFCMERSDVWKRLLGDSPTSIGHLDYLFARSLQARFKFELHAPVLRDYM